MNIMKLFCEKAHDLQGKSAITLAFLGDSVTQGCFEVYVNEAGDLEPVFDVFGAYHTYLKQILEVLYPSVPVNIINAGISGNTACDGLQRLQRDVLKYHPDLIVVCFGLNDCVKGRDHVDEYAAALQSIFQKVQEENIEMIFMTPNMMNTKISYHLKEKTLQEIAKQTQMLQQEGILELYLEKAKEVCQQFQVTICDCYEDWKKLEKYGVDITEHLSNYLNHPTKKMNWLFAIRLLETMMK